MRPYRKEMVASVVRNIVSDAIARRMHDPRLAPLTTVTRVEMTGDLQIAKVFLSIPGGESAERKTIMAMQHAAGYLQRLVAQGLSTRHCPELRFSIDEGLKNARKTMELLDDNRRKHPELFAREADAEREGAQECSQSDPVDAPSGGTREEAEE